MKITQKVDKSDNMIRKNKGETLDNDTFIIESPEEYDRIKRALHLYEDAENGNLTKKFCEKMLETHSEGGLYV